MTDNQNPETLSQTEATPEVDVTEHTEAPEPETFPAEYVKQLRKEAADNRAKAKRADDYAHELFTARVGALGKLHDPSDMPFDPALLDDPAKLAQAVDELAQRKPYLARTVITGDVGQGVTPTTPTVSLVDMLRD